MNTLPIWICVSPDGKVASVWQWLKDEPAVWTAHFGSASDPQQVEALKKAGWRAVQATLTWDVGEKSAAQRSAERLAQVTDDAVATFNASRLVRTNGGSLPHVNPNIGRSNRQAQVNRCIKVARDICVQEFDSKVITAEFWRTYWDECWSDDFIAGRTPRSNGHENWTASFEYLTRAKTMLAIFEKASA